MSDTTREFRREIDKAGELLGTLRDEMRVKAHLAGMEVRTRWEELESRANRLSREASAASLRAFDEVIQEFKKLSDSARHSS